MQNKLISFTEEQINQIEEYSEKYTKNFTESVRRLVDLGLNTQDGRAEESSLLQEVQQLSEKVEKFSWWVSDDNSSKLINLETALEDLTKKINILTAASKRFKGHLENRSIHLQD